jgi:uncharacterized protein (DUF2252 family)
MGGDKAQSEEAAQEIVRSYRKHIRRYAEMGHLQVWYDLIDEEAVLDALSPRLRRNAKRTLAKARRKNHVQTLDKLTERVNGEHRIIEDVPLIVRERLSDAGLPVDVTLDRMLHAYLDSLGSGRKILLSRYRIVDVARKVVGVGSVGTRAFIVLLQGRDTGDPLFLQVKEATASVLEDHLPKSRFQQPGERVVHGQRLMQAASDIFLGWTVGVDVQRHFYWRQLRDMKGSVLVEAMAPLGLTLYARTCGWTLARAHARSGDPVAIAEYLGVDDAFDRSITEFSERYADQNEQDFQDFVKAVRSGRIEALEGV